jgi:membrane protein DedA with SNARE-associated domain|tara:strand:+ start:555 stop:1214 length:660 start_codon:yes stop_codon:yes gene_type:complete
LTENIRTLNKKDIRCSGRGLAMPSFEALLADYGLLAIIILTFFEGETVVIIGAFLAHQGYFNPYLLGLCAFLGTFAGDQLWFYLGRRHADYKIVQKIRGYSSFARVLGMIERHPIKFIISFRFIYGIRNIAPVALGLSNVPAAKYLIFNMIAASVWATCFTTIGYLFGEAAERFIGQMAGVQHKIFGALLAGVVAYILFKLVNGYLRGRKNRKETAGDH